MTNLRLFTGNRLDILAETLAQALWTPLSSPLDKEVIVVQSKGMERWVSMELARHHGICANYEFLFPNAFFAQLFQRVLPDLPDPSAFDPRIMTWRLLKLLPSVIEKPGFEELRKYLDSSKDGIKDYQLLSRVADCFDQYLVFRPEMVFKWERGEEDHWQAQLWRKLIGEYGKNHRAQMRRAFLETVENRSFQGDGLPERISVFGISALPGFYVDLLAAISRFVQVNLFLIDPCQEYWGDLLSAWEMERTFQREASQSIKEEELHLQRGNSLLASMGKLGRDFFDLISEFDWEESSHFKDPGDETLLFAIQSDILNLLDRGDKALPKKAVAENDESIQIHSCHSPIREIEVLHDRLLEMFEKDATLMPKDILVMTPDIEHYAPYIQAVFDLPADDSRRIPFSVADRSIRKESEIVDTFLAIINLFGTRFAAPQVLSILESPAVRRKFEFLESEINLVRRWVNQTRIKWGVDGKSRSQLGLPPFPENTWKAGLERLLLGYAMTGKDEKMCCDILPYDDIEGSDTAVLGRFLEFVERLFGCVQSLAHARTLDEWTKVLRGILEGLFAPDKEQDMETQMVRSILNDLAETQELSGFDREIDINVVKCHLGNSFEKKGFGFGFLTGGVTFCAMLPMRSIPFNVICLVGMNGDAYPRQSKPPSFDLIVKQPRLGDRSLRNDDRYLFLEAILSAGKRLHISYVGQSVEDNSAMPPSVLVSELMDAVEEGFQITGKEILDHIITKHPLQAFSPEYFKGDGKLFSYWEENCQAAGCLLKARKTPMPFISRGLPPPEDTLKTVNIADLCRFFLNPAGFLLNTRLGISLKEKTLKLDERESFDIEGLNRYTLSQNLLEKHLSGSNLKELFPAFRATGRLPHGAVGECAYETLCQGVESFGKKIKTYLEEPPLDPLEVDLILSDFRLTGIIPDLYPDGLIRYRYARLKPKDRLNIWVYHLILNSLKAPHYPRGSMLFGLCPPPAESKWEAWEYAPVETGEEILEKLLKIYWKGLGRPLHFFPESSWLFAYEIVKKGTTRDDALARARSKWMGNDYTSGERDDVSFQLCFEGTDPLDSEFQTISEEVFQPILEHEREMKE